MQPAPRTNDTSQTPARKLDGLSGVVPTQTYRQALAEALGHRSYILLVLGFFTCGFQLGFVTLHLPPT